MAMQNKKRKMNSEIYINLVLKKLSLLFFKHFLKKEDNIGMEDKSGYYTS